MSGTKRHGGPATAAGKAITRMNATKHGLLSEVIPGHEVAAYNRHLELIRAHSQPRGYLEEILTERIANTPWRLACLARYEQAVIKRNVDRHFRHASAVSLSDLAAELEQQPGLRTCGATVPDTEDMVSRGDPATGQALGEAA